MRYVLSTYSLYRTFSIKIRSVEIVTLFMVITIDYKLLTKGPSDNSWNAPNKVNEKTVGVNDNRRGKMSTPLTPYQYIPVH